MKLNRLKIVVLLVMAMFSVQLHGQGADSLGYYLEIAAQNNPGVKADFLAYKASLQKVPQAGAYQDPQLEMGFFLKPMDIIDGRQIAEFKLMQMFPWFGTQKAAQAEAIHMAKVSFGKFRETRDNLYLNVYTQWYLLCSLQQQLMNNNENKTLLAQLEELAIRKYQSPGNRPGGAMSSASPGMSDVLRIRLEMAEIDNNIENLLSEIHAEKAKFNALLNRPADNEVYIPGTLEQLPFLFNAESAMARIENQNPALGMINEEGLAYKAKGEMDRKMSYPMFGIGLQYMLIGKSNAASMNMDAGQGMSGMNGKDMIMPMVSVTIPIYRNKYKAQQRESKLWRESNREKYDNTLNMLESELYKTKHELDNASRRIALYRKQEELARTTYSLIIQEFVSGKSDLVNVIQVQRQLLDYQLKEAEAIAGYNTMVASIQKLISFKDSYQ